MRILLKRATAIAALAMLPLAYSVPAYSAEEDAGIVNKIKGFFDGGEVQLDVSADVSAEVKSAITAAFAQSRPGLEVGNIESSEFSGLYEVQFKNGPVVYSSADGQFFLVGDLYENTATGIENVAERKLMPKRAEMMAAVEAKDMITFSPEGEAKAAIYVFTDVDCGYCQKLHREVPQLNAMGIEVRYLAFPRAGENSPTFNKMVTAWCADDRQQAMNVLKSRGRVDIKTCQPNPVAQQYDIGVAVGVTGTPAIVTESGRLIPGYRPAKDLAAIAIQ